MEGAEGHKEGSSEESGDTEECTREEKPDLDASKIGKSESSGGGETGESHQHPAVEDLADGLNRGDKSADETRQLTHQPPTGAGKPRIRRPGRRTCKRVSLTVEELKEEWSMQKAKINFIDKEKKRAQEELESFREQNEAERDALAKDLSDVKKCKTQVELEKEELRKAFYACFLENERFKDSIDVLRQRLQERVAEASELMKDKDGLSKTNEGLRKDLDMDQVELKKRETTIEDLKAQIQRFTADNMRSKVLQKVVDRLENELEQAGNQNDLLKAQLRDMTTEIRESLVAEREDERALTSMDDEAQASIAEAEGGERSGSLEDEMGGKEGHGAADQDEEAEQIVGDSADSSTGTQILWPHADAHKSSTDVETVDVPSAASTQDQKPKVKVGGATIGAQTIISTSPQGERSSKGFISRPDTIQTGDTSTFDVEIEAGKLEVSNKNMQLVDTPGLETDLSPSEKHIASPISDTPVDGTRPLSAAEENTPELTNGRLVPWPGSPVWVPRTPRIDFRFGTAELPAVNLTASSIEKRTTSRNSCVDTGGNRIENGGQTEAQSTQSRTTDGKLGESEAKSSSVATMPYSSIAWWMLFLGLALSWWLSEDHQQLWMQANEATRQTMVGLRDDRWAEAPWLARMSFTAENVLQIDRSMFA